MNVKEITEAASLHAGENIDIALARRFINEAIKILASNFITARVVSKTSFHAGGKNTATHIDGLYNVLRVFKDNAPTNLYSVFLQDVVFLNKGDYEIHYLKSAPDVASETDTLALSAGYCIGITKYTASRIRLLKDPDDNLGKRLLSEFQKDAEKENSSLLKTYKGKRKISTPAWR